MNDIATDKTAAKQSLPAIPIQGDIVRIPVSKLVEAIDKNNVSYNSRTERQQAANVEGIAYDEYKVSSAVEDFAASLAEVGQIETMIVFEMGDGTYGVASGETRRQAMVLNIERGIFKKDHEALCRVCSIDTAFMIGWISNEKRRSVGLYDKIMGYQRLKADGLSIEDMAAMNDVPTAEVKRILRLSNLHPKVMKYIHSNGMDIDTAVAFASSESQRLQLEIFKALGGGKSKQRIKSDDVRNLLQSQRLRGDSAVAKFVTLKSYKNAGGGVESDLFSHHSTVYLTSPDIVTQLMNNKLERIAKRHGARYKWCEIATLNDIHKYDIHSRLPLSVNTAPEPFMKELEGLRSELKKAENEVDIIESTADEEGKNASENDRYDELNQQICELCKTRDKMVNTINSKYMTHSDIECQHSGVVVSFDNNGRSVIYHGVQKNTEAKSLKKALMGMSDKASGEDALDSKGTPSSGTDELSAKLISDLELFRRQVVKVSLCDPRNIATARLLMEHSLCLNVLHRYSYGIKLSWDIQLPYETPNFQKMSESKAGSYLDELREQLPLDWIDAPDDNTDNAYSSNGSLIAFSKLSEDERDRLVAYCTAISLECCGRPISDLPSDIMNTLSPLPSACWRPSREGYFKHLKKNQLFSLGVEWYGEESTFASQHAKSNKGALLDAMCRIFESEIEELNELEIDIREHWLPDQMKF